MRPLRFAEATREAGRCLAYGMGVMVGTTATWSEDLFVTGVNGNRLVNDGKDGSGATKGSGVEETGWGARGVLRPTATASSTCSSAGTSTRQDRPHLHADGRSKAYCTLERYLGVSSRLVGLMAALQT
jgi:hypothetical protein